ncbi:hypothetical protein LTR36_005606 [Oleoguttula mirabilis]|uniref:Ubiquitin carboxyl-terminal hydrolase n=1 Tax=Oleoguttula mirabilis TaxID=1507867 RepID=A0AAV9JG31_9PEZI|nr:hypothetical protein LTR36_005606 [Oleoguttula mirabilis]
MMNHHMPAAAGPGQHLASMHPQSRRQQDYHTYHHPPPQSPIHPHAYANYHQQPFYPHPAQHAYPPQRWQPPYHPQQYMPPPQPQQQQYQPRSPMVVTSQPHVQAMTPVTRQMPLSQAPPQMQSVHSPRPTSWIPRQQPSQTLQAPPSPAPTPKQEPDSVSEQVPQQEVDMQSSAPASRRQSVAQDPLSLQPEHKTPFWRPLPWYSTIEAEAAFPPRATPRRRRRQNLHISDDAVALPARESTAEEPQVQEQAAAEEPPSETSTIAAPSEPETPATSQAPSESDYTQVSTPATPAQAAVSSPKVTPTQTHARRDTRTAIAVPNIPSLPKPRASPSSAEKQDAAPTATDASTPTPNGQAAEPAAEQTPAQEPAVEQTPATEEQATPKTPSKPAPPKSWADLVRTKAANGAAAAKTNGTVITNGTSLPKSASLAEALKQYSVQSDAALSFLEPRGLVNTGNMCYMNSILQVLVFCAPFYNFLEQVRQRTVHSLKSETPLIDATIMFMREFKVLTGADSVDGLRRLLKPEQLEQFGEPVTPDYVYDAIQKLSRFQNMRRGHQQDAEEFLGFFLEALHDECVGVMQGQDDDVKSSGTDAPNTEAEGWLEVGKKQKASVTRTAGQQDAPSPITKIFGGHLRSELRVPGLKDSVTLEPYKPLQLDIGAPHVNNIIDALKGITRTETLTGDFGGKSNTAKKQVFIDTLPSVLVLHLKRFQYDNTTAGTQKIWKKIGYPLELEIPKEVFPTAKRGALAVKGGLPKYKLIGVVYHHGKSAAGGHYTVDILRQDGREWIRMDDTIIRRIRPEDVAEGGSEEDPKLLAKALEQHKADQELQKQRNMYQGLDEAEKEPEEEKPWSEVNGNPTAKKQWSAAPTTNGTATPSTTTGKRTPTTRKEGVKDNKVAYILLYERMHG